MHGDLKATGQLPVRFTGVSKCGCGHGDLQGAERVISFLNELHAITWLLVLHEVQRDNQEPFLWQLVHFTALISSQVPFSECPQTNVIKQPVPVWVDHAGSLL